MFLLNNLKPYFQLQYDRDRRVKGAEILMRPSQGSIMDIVEKYTSNNQIHELDHLAFKHAIEFKQKYTELKVSSNISGLSFADKGFIKALKDIDPGASNILELTENRNLDSVATANINQLINYGFNLSLDDYGTANNSINRLASFKVSQLKIDRFTIKLLPEPKIVTILKHTINMCHQLGIEVVAEGVETQEQFEVLRNLDCDLFQGYLLHVPVLFV